MARGKGEGSIRQRPDGRWEGRIVINGDRKSFYGAARGEVRDAIRKALEAADLGLQDAEKILTGDYLDRWVENHVKPSGLAYNTYVSYRKTVAKIKPLIGRIPLRKLLPLHVSEMVGALLRDGESAWYQRYTVVVLKNAVRQAVRDKVLPVNHLAEVRVQKAKKPEIHHWNEDEVVRFFGSEHIDEVMYPFYTTAVQCGLRHSELLGLQWDDIDFKTNKLHVRRILIYVKEPGKKGYLTFTPPKTSSSRRAISLPDAVVSALKTLRAKRLEQGLAANPLVFCTRNGTPYLQSNVRKAFYRTIEQEGLKRITIHDLRHTCATLLLIKGVHPKIVQARLGHDKIGTTMDIYTPFLPSMDEAAAKQMDEVFSGVARGGK